MADEQTVQGISELVGDGITEFEGQNAPEGDGTVTEPNTGTPDEGQPGEQTPAPEGEGDEFTGDFEKDIPKEFHKHPRWQKIYATAKEARELKEQLAGLEGKHSIDDLTNAELAQLAKERGLIQDTAPAPKAEDQFPYDLENATPEQRQLHKFVEAIVKQNLNPVEQSIQANASKLNQQDQAKQNATLVENETATKDWVETTLKMNWKTEGLPGIKALISDRRKSNPNWGQGLMPMDVAKIWASEKGIEIGKKLGVTEQNKLNEQKKRKQIEAEHGLPTGSETDYSKMASVEDLVDTAQREASSKFS